MKPIFSRSISAKPTKKSKEYEVQGDISPMSTSTHEENCISTKSHKIKYRKSSLSRGNLSSSRATSMHNINVDLSHKLNQISKQKFYLLPHEDPNYFIVYGDSSSKYNVEIGPQLCSCTSTSSNASFPCVHLLFIMCKVLQVSERDPILLSEKLRTSDVDNLLSRFIQRKKDKVKKSSKSNSKLRTDSRVEIKSVKKSTTKGIFSSRSDKSIRSNNYYNSGINSPEIDKNELDEIICSICLYEMNISSQQLIFCDSCNNEFHKKCISIWMKECRKQEEPITCPLCRDIWEDNKVDDNNLTYGIPRSQSTFVPGHSHRHQQQFEMIGENIPTNMVNSTSNIMSSRNNNNSTVAIDNITTGTSGTQTHNKRYTGSNELSSSSKCLGYCFSEEIVQLLSSDKVDHRENGLRVVAEKTVHIVMSAGVSHTHQCGNDSTHDHIGSMGGHTTGVILKESFRVIARFLDDNCYTLFLAALRAFREILGYVVCRNEQEVERMSRMISPVICQLIRICGDFTQKKKSQMSLSALFELAKGQDGGISLGRELKSKSMEVTSYQRLAKYVLSDSSRFRTSHCYGRLALLERLLDKFDLGLELLHQILIWVGRQLSLMHRSVQLMNNGNNLVTGAGLYMSDLSPVSPTVPGYNTGACATGILETTDVDTGLSTSDIKTLSDQKLHKMAKLLYITVARKKMSLMKFNNHSTEQINDEMLREVRKMPDSLRDKFIGKLKLSLSPPPPPASSTTTASTSHNLGMMPIKSNSPNSKSASSMIKKEPIGGSTVAISIAHPSILQIQQDALLATHGSGTDAINNNSMMVGGTSGFSKSYRMSKRYTANNKSNNSNNNINFIKQRTRSLGSSSGLGTSPSCSCRSGTTNQVCHHSSCINNPVNQNTNPCRISPFIRITPEPAYDAVPLSDDGGLEEDDDDEFLEQIDDDDDNSELRRQEQKQTKQFLSELAMHNSMYGQNFVGLNNTNNNNANNNENNSNITNKRKDETKEALLHNKSLEMITSIVKEINQKPDMKELEIESRPPPGLGVFTGNYKAGRDWVQGHLLGTGAFSKCYQARDSRTGLLMAVKQIPLGPGLKPVQHQMMSMSTTSAFFPVSVAGNTDDRREAALRAVRTEAQLMTRLRHPNVLPLLGVVLHCVSRGRTIMTSTKVDDDDDDEVEGDVDDGDDESSSSSMIKSTTNPPAGEWTISMFVRWMPGGSVASCLAQYGPFRETNTLAYAIQAARGLAYIHNSYILHRDLKGANLLLDTSGMRLRISDFGASARLSNGRDSNASNLKGQLLGTIAFMAPEVLRGEQYGRSCDVWSFACCIIEMLTGNQPWRDHKHTNHLALMYTIASAEEPPKLPENISKDLRDLLNDCLNRQAKQRPLSSKLESYKVFQQLLSC